VPFPTEAARDVLGLLRSLWLAEVNPERRRVLAAAGHKVRQALELAETDPAAAHALVNAGLVGARDALKFHDALVPAINAAIARVGAK
jgi:hypothetical protein